MPDDALAVRVRTLLDPFDPLQVECDGFSRIASYILTQNKIRHQVMGGSVSTPKGEVPLHWWIVVGSQTVDYRLRMWAGSDMPHGVFVPPEGILYEGTPTELMCSRIIFEALTSRLPSPLG